MSCTVFQRTSIESTFEKNRCCIHNKFVPCRPVLDSPREREVQKNCRARECEWYVLLHKGQGLWQRRCGHTVAACRPPARDERRIQQDDVLHADACLLHWDRRCHLSRVLWQGTQSSTEWLTEVFTRDAKECGKVEPHMPPCLPPALQMALEPGSRGHEDGGYGSGCCDKVSDC